MTKLEERRLAPMCNNFLNTSHSLSSLLVCLYFSLLYSGIPVTKSQCLARLEWIPLYRVGPKSISLHREGENPILELSQLLDTLSDVPITYFTTSQLREDSSKNQSTFACVKQLDTLMV